MPVSTARSELLTQRLIAYQDLYRSGAGRRCAVHRARVASGSCANCCRRPRQDPSLSSEAHAASQHRSPRRGPRADVLVLRIEELHGPAAFARAPSAASASRCARTGRVRKRCQAPPVEEMRRIARKAAGRHRRLAPTRESRIESGPELALVIGAWRAASHWRRHRGGRRRVSTGAPAHRAHRAQSS